MRFSELMCEHLAAFVPMRRWWVNTTSGDVLAVPEDATHLSYMQDNQTQFGIDYHHKWSEADKLSKVAAQRHWHPADYDGQMRCLTVRFDNGTQKVLRRVLQSLIDQLPDLQTVVVEVGKKTREMTGDRLAHFLRNGRLPAK
jgi:hypothetical protein